jgi:hypothetical protein
MTKSIFNLNGKAIEPHACVQGRNEFAPLQFGRAVAVAIFSSLLSWDAKLSGYFAEPKGVYCYFERTSTL